MKGKKLLSILLAFALVLSMFPVLTASAGWTKNIYVCGVQIKDTNCTDILGDGRFSYNDYEKTLYVKGDVVGYEGDIIVSDSQNLKILPEGKRTLSCTGYALNVTDNTILTSGGDAGNTLVLNTTGTGPAVGVGGNVTLTLDGAFVSALGGRAGFAGPIYGTNEAKLIVKNSTVHASGDEAAIHYFKGGIELIDCSFDINGLHIEGHEVLDSKGNTAKSVDIKPMKTYDIWVCGTQVTEKNLDDVLGDGTCKFQVADSYLFVFKDITYDGADAAVESKLGKELNLCLKADATIKNTGNGNAVYSNDGLKISGDVKLTAIAAGSDTTALKADGTLTITAGMDVTAEGGAYGIYGKKVVIETATVAAKGGTNAIRASEEGLHLSAEIGVVQPIGGQIFGSDIRDKDGAPATEVLLQKVDTYDLMVCGKQVNSANCKDVLGDGIFSYDPNTTILTINGDCENMGTIIESKISGMVIKFAKDVTLRAIDSHAFLLYAPARIEGPGKLTVSNALSCIFVSGCAFSIKNAKLELNGKNGVYGENGASLYIYNSEISVKANTAAISGFKTLSLTDCDIIAPEKAEIKDGGIMVGDELAKDVQIGAKTPVVYINPFVDVKESDYFYDAVLWAYYHAPQITKGVDDTHFAPTDTCTRGQIVTFLWRAMGEPAPTITENPFVDVKESDYYYTAVLWAFEKGITTGTDETHFAPNDFCKREHAVAFLYRTAGKPAYTNKTNPFVDVKADAYYYDAVLWAVEKGITKGTDETHFSPADACQRCQIVTFLYRFMNP